MKNLEEWGKVQNEFMLKNLVEPTTINKEYSDDDKREKQVAVTTIRVPVDKLVGSQGIVVGDIVSKKGAVILPAGVDISLFDSSMGSIVNKLKQEGIR
ncbi:MAG: hypothetical protein LBK91_04090, partial [Synergistaceae bacterium]|nr:hypothetical protein [Synergistaceae bacterium]